MQNHYLVLSLPNALRRFICGVVKRDCQRNALGDRRCLVTQLSVGRFAKNNGNWGLKWQRGLNKRIYPDNAPALIRDLNFCER
jgi:hypothetical protein